MLLALARDLAGIVRPGALWWAGATAIEGDAGLDRALADAEARVRRNPPAPSASVRTMYRKVGLDPTRTRPSSEALLRRVIRGEGLPRINAIVDVGNWCSMEFQLPYGLYDLARIRGGVSLRLGRDGEEYAGIRKDVVHVAGRLTLADEEGPFGNPSADSARTMVTPATTDALIVIFAPADLSPARVAEVVDATAARVASVCGGRETGRMAG